MIDFTQYRLSNYIFYKVQSSFKLGYINDEKGSYLTSTEYKSHDYKLNLTDVKRKIYIIHEYLTSF